VTTRDDAIVETRSRIRELVAADFRPVRPLRTPWVRAMALAPLAAAMLALLPLVIFHVRTDVDRLSPLVTWGASIGQAVLGLALGIAACRQVVPGQWQRPAVTVGWLAGAAAGVAAVMWMTWGASPVSLPPSLWRESTYACLQQSFLDGLPVLVVALVLASRGLAARPALVGALAGLSAGTISDAAWRMVCVVTEPSHVGIGHMGAVLALALTGSAALSAWARLSRPRPRGGRPPFTAP
jgi:hypothetical protein